MTLTGKILVIGQTESVGTNNFKKRLLVVETEEQYSQKIPIDFLQDKCDLLDRYQVGQKVTVSINLRGNEYNGKYYAGVQGWRIEGSVNEVPVNNAQIIPPTNGHDDLPF
jgi:hypothetical protein